MICNLPSQRRTGAMLLLVAFMLVILVAMTVFSVDIAYMQLVRTELRTATDSAARAASESLTRTQDVNLARQAAIDAANENSVGTSGLGLSSGDIVFGSAETSGGGQYTFVPGDDSPNAVRVSASPGSVPLFLGSILGQGCFQPEMFATSSGFERDIAIVVDRSGSMSGQKIADLRAAVALFLGILDNTPSDERVSLASYADTASKDENMTSDLDKVESEVDDLEVGGMTAIGDGLQIGTDSLEFDGNARPFAKKAIVLMTDGIENTGTPVLDVVPTAVARGHVIHTVTFGEGADIVKMQTVAAQTGGTHQHANTGADLLDAFRQIAESLAVTTIE